MSVRGVFLGDREHAEAPGSTSLLERVFYKSESFDVMPQLYVDWTRVSGLIKSG